MGQDDVIRSRSNPLVRRLRELVRGDVASGLLVVEGVRLAEEAVAARLSIVEAAVVPDADQNDRVRKLVAALETRGTPVRRLDRSILGALSDVETSQGVLLIARRPAIDARGVMTGAALTLVVAGVQNPGNLGSLVRTAEAAGVSGVFVGEESADPFSPKALRGAMGSAFRVPVAERAALVCLAELRQSGATIWAATAGGKPYDEIDWHGASALVVGNEGAGLSEDIVAASSGRVTIPMSGPVESLNVAVAAGVILFEAARQRRKLR
jgi:RNA methyltransferase, TrmH family